MKQFNRFHTQLAQLQYQGTLYTFFARYTYADYENFEPGGFNFYITCKTKDEERTTRIPCPYMVQGELYVPNPYPLQKNEQAAAHQALSLMLSQEYTYRAIAAYSARLLLKPSVRNLTETRKQATTLLLIIKDKHLKTVQLASHLAYTIMQDKSFASQLKNSTPEQLSQHFLQTARAALT